MRDGAWVGHTWLLGRHGAGQGERGHRTDLPWAACSLITAGGQVVEWSEGTALEIQPLRLLPLSSNSAG